MSRKKINYTVDNLEVIDINAKGKGVAKGENGAVYFIEDTVPGDKLSVSVFKKRRGYFEAKPLIWNEKSVHRTTPPCDHFGVCGGCKWQHMDYHSQLEFKQKGISHNLTNIGKVAVDETLPILGADPHYHYRNKMEFSFSNRRWLSSEEIQSEEVIERRGLGFHKPNMWDKIVDIQNCHLQAEPSNAIRNAIRDFAIKNNLSFFDAREQEGFLRTLMIRTTQKGEVMVLLQFFYKDQSLQDKVLGFLQHKFPEITSLLYCINTKANDTLYDQDIHCFSGKTYITENMEDLIFKITAKSFYQTNPKQALLLYKVVKEFASLEKQDTVYDLYTGTGTIGLFLAKGCAKIIGIESVPEAIEAARINAKENTIDNAVFEVGDMKNSFNDAFVSRHGEADVIITDPPRNGMHPDVVKQLLYLKPKKIVYVSCNSATQARDLELMRDSYSVEKSQAVDMFPQTHHVENVVLLKRIN